MGKEDEEYEIFLRGLRKDLIKLCEENKFSFHVNEGRMINLVVIDLNATEDETD